MLLPGPSEGLCKSNIRIYKGWSDGVLDGFMFHDASFKKTFGQTERFFTFVPFLDLLPISILGLSLLGFASVTASNRVDSSFIMLNRRFL